MERLRPFVGRMTNAMVAVLGPELTPDGDNFRICKSLMRLMEPAKADQSLVEAGLSTLAALESVLYAQQLVLFAPHAVPTEKHLPILMVSLQTKPLVMYTSGMMQITFSVFVYF